MPMRVRAEIKTVQKGNQMTADEACRVLLLIRDYVIKNEVWITNER